MFDHISVLFYRYIRYCYLVFNDQSRCVVVSHAQLQVTEFGLPKARKIDEMFQEAKASLHISLIFYAFKRAVLTSLWSLAGSNR